MLALKSPLTVVGDIHGQYFDLLNIFERFGSAETEQYLFLGDYVDRGKFCIEVMTLMLLLKLRFPKQIHLLRGNHESRTMTTYYNFRLECKSALFQAKRSTTRTSMNASWTSSPRCRWLQWSIINILQCMPASRPTLPFSVPLL